MTSIKRILKAGFVNFWRSGFVSLAAVAVMTITLFVTGFFYFLNGLLNDSLSNLQEKVDISVYFVLEAPESEILDLKKSLEREPEVAAVEYVSREEALKRFEERHASDQLTLQALEELGENPLPASLRVTAKDTTQYERIAAFLKDDRHALSKEGNRFIESVNYEKHKDTIDQLANMIDAAQKFSIVVTVIFVLTASLITFNTIALAIYTAREEIAVMRLVGASNMYIRGPFMFEGALYGAIAGFVTLFVFYPFTLWLGPYTEKFFVGGVSIYGFYLNHFFSLALLLIGGGIMLGVISSFLAVKRYLKI